MHLFVDIGILLKQFDCKMTIGYITFVVLLFEEGNDMGDLLLYRIGVDHLGGSLRLLIYLKMLGRAMRAVMSFLM